MTGGRDLVAPDMAVSFGTPDYAVRGVRASYVIALGPVGVARLLYSIDVVCGPLFAYRLPVSEERRALIAEAVRRSGVLKPGMASVGMDGGGPWLAVQADGVRRWVKLPANGMVGGFPIVALMEGLVPTTVWDRVARRRAEYLAAGDEGVCR